MARRLEKHVSAASVVPSRHSGRDGGTDGGDGNLTKQTQHVDSSTTRVTSFQYDWRNRQTAVDGEVDLYERRYHDNLARVIKTERYDTKGRKGVRSQ